MAVAALVLGICSIVFSFLFTWVGAILGIVGIVLGALARKNPQQNKGMATAGLAMSIVGLVLSIVIIIACTIIVSNATPVVYGF